MERRSERERERLVWIEKEKGMILMGTSEFRDRAPTAMAMLGDIIEKLFIFIRRPKSFP